MTTETILTGLEVSEIYSRYGSYNALRFVRAIEQAVLQSEQIRSMQGMAECMAMVWQELVEAGIVTDKVPPMMVANAVLAEIQALRKDAELFQFILEEAWFQRAFDRFDPDDNGDQSKFESECRRILRAAMEQKT